MRGIFEEILDQKIIEGKINYKAPLVLEILEYIYVFLFRDRIPL